MLIKLNSIHVSSVFSPLFSILPSPSMLLCAPGVARDDPGAGAGVGAGAVGVAAEIGDVPTHATGGGLGLGLGRGTDPAKGGLLVSYCTSTRKRVNKYKSRLKDLSRSADGSTSICCTNIHAGSREWGVG